MAGQISNRESVRQRLEQLCDLCDYDLSRPDTANWSWQAISCLKNARFAARIGLRNIERGDHEHAAQILATAQLNHKLASEEISRPLAERGAEFSETQRKRAKKPRNPIRHIIERLARRQDVKPSELWDELIGELDVAGLAPQEVIDTHPARKDQRNDRIDYDGGCIKRGNFYQRLRRLRNSTD